MTQSAILTLAIVVGGWGAPAEIPSDTLVRASPGDRLLIRELTGRLTVTAGPGDVIEVLGREENQAGIQIRREGRSLVLARTGRADLPGRLTLSVPDWLEVDVRGATLDVSIEGSRGELSVWTAVGDVALTDVRGVIDVTTVQGDLTVTGVGGEAALRTIAGSVVVRSVEGSISVETTEGDVRLQGVTATSVVARSLSGDLDLQGVLSPGGSYQLGTHGGDIEIELPPDTSAKILFSTYDGQLESDFPLTLDRFLDGREMDFTLGGGGSTLTLETFDGDVRIRRAGRARAPSGGSLDRRVPR